MRENVRFEVGGLSKLFIASVEGADVGPVAGVNAHVCAEVKVQREAFPTALKRTLKGFFSGVHQLMALEFGALHEGLPALCAHMNPRAVSVKVFPHG